MREWSSCRGLALSKTFFISASQSLLFSNLTILPNHTSSTFSFTLDFDSSLRVSHNSLDHSNGLFLFPGTESQGSFTYYVKEDNYHPLYPQRSPFMRGSELFLFTRCFQIYHSYSDITSHCNVTTNILGKSSL